MTGKDITIAVATTAIDIVGGAYGVAGIGAAVNPLLQKLLRLQAEQEQSARRIEKGVQQLINSPWKTARLHLDECRLPGRSPEQIKQSLHKAADKLREALSMHEPRTFAAAYVAYDLAVVLALAEDGTASRYYAERSAEAATGATIDSIRRIKYGQNGVSGMDGLILEVRLSINNARRSVNEVRLKFDRVFERTFGRTFWGPPTQPVQPIADRYANVPIDDWYGIVKGASILCKNNSLATTKYAALKVWLDIL